MPTSAELTSTTLYSMSKIIKNSTMVGIAYASIPKQQNVRELVNRYGNTQDIINQVQKCFRETTRQTAQFAKKIKGPTVEDSLKNVFAFVKHNIHYEIDPLGVQDIKEPSAIWWSRFCDCKGYSIFIRSLLSNMGIKAQFKYADYDNSTESKKETHVYVIVPKAKGGYTTLDGCMKKFNMEKPVEKFTII